MKFKTITRIVVDYESLRKDVEILNITQRHMAKSLGTSPANVNRWIKGSLYVPDKFVKPLEKYIEERKSELKNYLKGDENNDQN